MGTKTKTKLSFPNELLVSNWILTSELSPQGDHSVISKRAFQNSSRCMQALSKVKSKQIKNKASMANTSAMWQQIAHTTYQLSSPCCSTRAIQKKKKKKKKNENGRDNFLEKHAGERNVSRKIRRHRARGLFFFTRVFLSYVL